MCETAFHQWTYQTSWHGDSKPDWAGKEISGVDQSHANPVYIFVKETLGWRRFGTEKWTETDHLCACTYSEENLVLLLKFLGMFPTCNYNFFIPPTYEVCWGVYSFRHSIRPSVISSVCPSVHTSVNILRQSFAWSFLLFLIFLKAYPLGCLHMISVISIWQ